jgi:hypothetical protein
MKNRRRLACRRRFARHYAQFPPDGREAGRQGGGYAT